MQDSHRPISLYPHPAANITAFGSTAKRAIPINRKAREARKGALENLEGSNASFFTAEIAEHTEVLAARTPIFFEVGSAEVCRW
jgi:hypothetical protein